jgi:hypothetical protein
MPSSSKAFASESPTDAAGGSLPAPPRAGRRAVAAAALLLLSLYSLYRCLGSMLLGMDDSLVARIFGHFAYYLTPIANITSLVLGNRRRAWVKLNYLVIAVWFLIIGLNVYVLFFFVSDVP